MQLLINHIGYLETYPIRVVIQSLDAFIAGKFRILNTEGTCIHKGNYDAGKQVDQWHTGYYAELVLDHLTVGTFIVCLDANAGDTKPHKVETSIQVTIQINRQEDYKHLSSIYTQYFNKQRSSGPTDEKDKRSTLIDHPNKVVDLSGGWYDASGDTSKYLSHLSVANFMNPQQIPLVAYALLSQIELHQGEHKENLVDEAVHGLDFLCRAQSEDGYFYTTVFDNWNKELETREICSFTTQEGFRNNRYQASFRAGGGMSIAALAKGSQYNKSFLAIAEKGYIHLMTHNLQYCEDGLENIIDYYTALLATVELFKAGSKYINEKDIQHWAQKLLACQSQDDNFVGYFRSREELDRPFTHSSDEGLPIIALLSAYEALSDESVKSNIKNACKQWWQYLLTLSNDTYNPFHYPRHYAKPVGHPKMTSFFFPHANETGYWWQGENARLGSLASAIFHYLTLFPNDDNRIALLEQVVAMRNWLFGMNPFDLTMVYGEGKNTDKLDVGHAFGNTNGGICNGITASLYSSFDIAMMETDHLRQFWRWSEQWLPHTSWWLMALGNQNKYEQSQR